MYAVIKTGGKQYKVVEGETLKVEKLDAQEGDSINFDQVLMVQSDDGLKVGAPFLEGGTVKATIKSHGRLKKVHILKFKRRKQYMKRMGHRQHFSEVLITGISV